MYPQDDLSFPIGKIKLKSTYTQEETQRNIQVISALPSKLINLAGGWQSAQLDTPYRPGGWTAKQLIHHIADSHMHAYLRCKHSLTEDTPTIKPYLQDQWAALADSEATPVEVSLQLLKYLHIRWVLLLNSLNEAEMARPYLHPETQLYFRLDQVIAVYAWHSEHHYQHLYRLAERENWL